MDKVIYLIIIINVSYMTLMTLRTILVIKGYKTTASFISMLEVFIYLMGLTMVLGDLNEPSKIFAYCLGWGIGVYCGSTIEKRLALGYISFEIIVETVDLDLLNKIRSQGYGVTSWFADGKDGRRLCMTVLAKRNNEQKLKKYILSNCPNAFIITYEPSSIHGGFLTKSVSKISAIPNGHVL